MLSAHHRVREPQCASGAPLGQARANHIRHIVPFTLHAAPGVDDAIIPTAQGLGEVKLFA